jgi:hypothetical protein
MVILKPLTRKSNMQFQDEWTRWHHKKVLAKLFNKRHNLKEVAASQYKPGRPILEKL